MGFKWIHETSPTVNCSKKLWNIGGFEEKSVEIFRRAEVLIGLSNLQSQKGDVWTVENKSTSLNHGTPSGEPWDRKNPSLFGTMGST